MILEGLITSCDAAGGLHLAAMGPEVDEAACLGGAIEQLVLKPFETSQTAANLARLPEGVFHLSDDVLLLARVVTGSLAEPPACRPAVGVRGWVGILNFELNYGLFQSAMFQVLRSQGVRLMPVRRLLTPDTSARCTRGNTAASLISKSFI